LSNEEDRRLGERPIANPRAFELFLQARAAIRGFTTLARGKELARQAIAIEGDTPPLLWLLAWADVSLVKVGMGDPALLGPAAVEADRLLSLAPEASYGYSLRGYIDFERGRHPEAVRDFRAALERDPNDTDSMFWMCVAFWNAGHPDLATPVVERMVAVDPLAPASWLAKGVTAWFQGHFADGVPAVARSIELDPDAYMNRWSAAYTCALVNDLPGALAHLAWCRAAGPQVPYTWQIDSLLASLQGDRARARDALAPVTTTALDFHLTFHFAESFAMAGAIERALEVLEQGVEKGFYAYEFIRDICPFVQPLRGMPEFERILAKARARWEEFGRTDSGKQD
jgi:tetratricopeptide (TPR) repeat protein